MKKIAAVLVLALLLTGCLNREARDVYVTPVKNSADTEQFLYTPGTYEGSAQGYSGLIRVSVTVDESKITAVEILSSAEANYTEKQDSGQPGSGTDSGSGTSGGTDSEAAGTAGDPAAQTASGTPESVEVVGKMDSILDTVLATQDLSVSADLMTGATVSCQAVLEAIRQALNSATLK